MNVFRICLGTLLVAALTALAIEACTPRIVERPSDLSMAMGDIDTWAGLSTPHKEPKQSPEDRKRAEAKICVAQAVYGEARGEAWLGKVAVAQVVMRRAGLDYRYACRVVRAPAQFAPLQGSGAQWQWAIAAAEEAMRWSVHGGPDYSNRASHFYSGAVAPYWAAAYEHVATLGGHKFFR